MKTTDLFTNKETNVIVSYGIERVRNIEPKKKLNHKKLNHKKKIKI